MRSTIPVALLLLVPLGLATPVPAPQFGPQTNVAAPLQDGITVTGVGRARLSADTAEVRLRVRAKAKTLPGAQEEFQGRRGLLTKVLESFEGAEVTSDGVTVGPESANQNNFVFDGSEPTPPQLEMREVLAVRLQASAANLEPVVSLIAEAKDADCVLDADGPNPYFMYTAPEDRPAPAVRFFAGEGATKEARELATTRAFEDARERAEALARIAGLRLLEPQAVRILKPFEGGAVGSGNGEREVKLEVRFRAIP